MNEITKEEVGYTLIIGGVCMVGASFYNFTISESFLIGLVIMAIIVTTIVISNNNDEGEAHDND